MTKRFMDIKPGDELYQTYRYQPICENISALRVDGIIHYGEHAGRTFSVYSDKNGNYNCPIFKDELEISHITLTDKILATSLEALKQAMIKDIAFYNKSYKRYTVHA